MCVVCVCGCVLIVERKWFYVYKQINYCVNRLNSLAWALECAPPLRVENIPKQAPSVQENLLLEFLSGCVCREECWVCVCVCVCVGILRDLAFNSVTFNVTIKFHFVQVLNYFCCRHRILVGMRTPRTLK